MTKKENLSKSYSGLFGHQVEVRNRRGKAVITIPPVKPKMTPSDKQVAVRERLKLAAVYARNVIDDPSLLAKYTAKAHKGMPPFRLAMNDFLRPPYIHKVDTSGYHGNPGDKITVIAGDDFKLDTVAVNISDTDGNTIEEGACVFTMPTGNYEYTAQEQLPDLSGIIVFASAKDTPGNITTLSISL